VTGQRYQSLDAIRGIAVMGILLMNIVAFAMPEVTYLSPQAFGHHSSADWAAWGVMAVLVDGKMRGLFSMLFGASMLLVYERAEASGGNGRSVHKRRMICLLAFGLLHYFLIWMGDILSLYALCGFLGMFLLQKDEAALRRAAFWLLGLSFVLLALLMTSLFIFQYQALKAGADPETLKKYLSFVADVGGSPKSIAADIALHQGSWIAITQQKLTEDAFAPLNAVFFSGLETLGLMALGMMLFRNGFLTGDWAKADYRKMMMRAYGLGIPPLVLLELANWSTGFDPVFNLSLILAFTAPFRLAITVGHAALAMLLVQKFQTTGTMARTEAAGKAAFTNYLGTSILMTAVFYGWGFGQYGRWSRIEIYAIVPFAWVVMLLWSKPWLDRFTYGPLEWVWRCLARGEWIALRRKQSA
jgi:uncharacterized protein